MSTPIPPNIKLEGLDLYAPRGARTPSAPGSQDSPSQTCPDVPECDPLRAESKQPHAAATESLGAAGSPVDDAIETTHSFRDREPSVSALSLPPAPKLRSEGHPVDEPPPPTSPPWLAHDVDRTAQRRRLPLDPGIAPPPTGVRPDIVTPILIVLIAGCAAVVGLTMISAFQPDAHPPKRTSESIPTAASTVNKAGSEPRLVVDVQKAFANEPLSLGVSVDSAAADESLMLAGLALGTRLSAGVPVSEASWQLAPRDLNGVYVYAPKDYVGIMNTAIELLSANQRLIESRAVRLEWIAKSDSSPQTKRMPGALNAPAVQPMNPEDAFLMERGLDLLKSGDIASARLLFQRLSNAGSADAALVLAATYDTRYLAQHSLIGVAGDGTKAHDWYQRASELGSIEAGRILARTNAD
jgi:hypothetical protein